MSLVLRNFPKKLAFLILFSATVMAAFAQTPVSRVLVLDQPTTREIKGGEAHFYTV